MPSTVTTTHSGTHAAFAVPVWPGSRTMVAGYAGETMMKIETKKESANRASCLLEQHQRVPRQMSGGFWPQRTHRSSMHEPPLSHADPEVERAASSENCADVDKRPCCGAQKRKHQQQRQGACSREVNPIDLIHSHRLHRPRPQIAGTVLVGGHTHTHTQHCT